MSIAHRACVLRRDIVGDVRGARCGRTMKRHPPTPISKLTIPSVAGAVPRGRLFKLFDDAGAGHRAVWLQGPPGAGKTTLAAGYGHAAARPVLWYRLDEADADPAAFFGYFKAAAQRSFRRRSTPDFGPEYLGGLAAFARMFFRAALPARKSVLVVFDDCHIVPDHVPLSSLLAILCEETPPGSLCLFLSRNGPPPAFASLAARGELFTPAAEILHFDEAETALLAHRSGAARDSAALAAARANTGGWAAALAILLRHGDATAAAMRDLDGLAAEAWRMLPASAQAHLLATCVLETVTPESAVGLAGSPDATETFRRLAADCYLVSQTESPARAWRVHPLWRAHLLARARERYGADGFGELQRRAAVLARGEGHFDEAAALSIASADWAGLRELIAVAAREYLGGGRHLQLLEWLAALPEGERGDPWLFYWEGLARMPIDPKAALACLGRAHGAFGEDPLGRLLSAAGALSAIMFAWDDMSEGPRWLAELERLEPFREALANPEIDAVVIASGNAVLLFDLGNPLLIRWAQAAERVLPQAPPVLQTLIASFLINYYVWHGELAACRVLIHSLRDDYPNAGSLFAVTRHVWSAVIGFLSADHEAAYADVEAARKLVAQYGLVFYLPQTYGHEAYTALSALDLPRAARVIEAMAAMTLPGRRLDRGFLHHVRSGLLLAQGNHAEARREAELVVTLSEEAGASTNVNLVRGCLAQILVRQGAWDEAEPLLDQSEAYCIANRAPLIHFVVKLTRADGLLHRGDADGAAAILRDALPAACRNDWYNAHPFWQPAPMARLCALALERGIEPDYVRRLIRRRALPAPADAGETWPWPVRIRALGPLEVELRDAPLDFPVRAQGKPLELLRRLVAHGGEHVPLTVLAESLWPEADGDRARAALKTTLQRLRHLLGHGALVQREGRVSLDAREVWLDLRAFECLLRESRDRPDTASLERALDLYRGMLLSDAGPDEPEIPARQRLHAAYIAGVERLCEALIADGAGVRAVQRYRTAIAVDPCSELLQCRYLELCARLGLHGDAVQAYRDYEQQLKAKFGIAPSPEIRALVARNSPGT